MFNDKKYDKGCICLVHNNIGYMLPIKSYGYNRDHYNEDNHIHC